LIISLKIREYTLFYGGKMPYAIKIDGLKHKFSFDKGFITVLDEINLTLENGEFVSLVGASGSGKSTLLNLIGGLCRPTEGEICINGKSLAQMNENQLAIFRRKHVGFVFQSYNLLPSLTAWENVALPLFFAGIPKSARMGQAKKILDIVGLSHRLTHKPSELSGGEQQRIGIARALINEPDVVLADEPTGNLDSATSEDIMELLSKMNREKNITVLMVTHNIAVARRTRKVIHLKDGRIERIVASLELSTDSPKGANLHE